MTVQLGAPAPAADAFHLARTSRRPFADVLAAVRAGIEAEGMKVLHEIDPQAALHGFGHAIGGARLVFFFHPLLLLRLLEADWTAIVDAPLKLALIELPGGAVHLRMARPDEALARYGNPALARFGQELAAACVRVLDAAAPAGSPGEPHA